MDGESLKWAIGQGGLAVAFVVLFHFYRKDVKSYTELWQTVSADLMTVVKENTVAQTRLIASVDAMQGLLAQLMAERGGRRQHDQGFSTHDRDTRP